MELSVSVLLVSLLQEADDDADDSSNRQDRDACPELDVGHVPHVRLHWRLEVGSVLLGHCFSINVELSFIDWPCWALLCKRTIRPIYSTALKVRFQEKIFSTENLTIIAQNNKKVNMPYR